MIPRMWHIMLVGLGGLMLLIVLSGLSSYRWGTRIYRNIVTIHEDYSHRQSVLEEVRSGIYLSSVLVRDYLLDPSHITAAGHREQLLKIRSSMAARLREIAGDSGQSEREALARLESELNSYWDTMDPIFDWTIRQKVMYSATFLRKEVLPRRTAVLDMAAEAALLNANSFRERQQRVDASLEEFWTYTVRTIALTVLLGLVISVSSSWWMITLEKRAKVNFGRTELAEREMRSLSQQLVQAQEEERRRIARELHDEVGQMITALRLELGNLEALRSGPAEVFAEHVADAKGLAEKTLRSVRGIAMGLRPALLDDLGLGPALEWQCREFSRRTGIPVEVRLEGFPAELPDAHRTSVYRVIQEALTNCARHAQASRIRVIVHAAPDRITFTVEDDGVGFVRRPGAGMGLTGAEERVRELRGSLVIRSTPGRGTLLQGEIPIPPETRPRGQEALA